MYRFCKIPLNIDPTDLLSAYSSIEMHHPWIPHFVTRNYEGDWSVIPLRSVSGCADHIFSDPAATPDAYRDTPQLAAAPYIREVLAMLHCPHTSVRLMKLAAGGVIKEHCDHDLTFDQGSARLHIPIQTSSQVDFFIENERVIMDVGECWYIDASRPHRLANRGENDRIHLVIDCIVNNWLRDCFANAGYRPRKKSPLEERGIPPGALDQVIAALHAMGTEAGLRQAQELEALRDGAANGAAGGQT